MNRVIIIHLNGNAYQLEESGYDALRTYLDNAARRLEGNPDKDEIMTDIEQAIAEKFRTVLGAGKNVVMTKEVESALAEMGPVQDGTAGEAGASSAKADPASGAAQNNPQSENAASGTAHSSDGPVKRLYTIREGAMIAGVCNGLAAYIGIDVTIVRLVFVLLTWFWGVGILTYVVLALIVPAANTSAEKAAAYGTAATAQEFIRRAKEGYYEGLKSLHDKQSRREWKRKFKQDMRNWSRNFEREIRHHTDQWQSNWNQNGPHYFRPPFATPLFTLLDVSLALLAVFAVYSLVKTGVVFGLALPVGIPLWIGIVCIIVAWHGLAWPVKAMRWHAYYGSCRPKHGPLGGLGDFCVGIAGIVLVLWLADHYVPQFHEAMKQLPPFLHRAIDAVQNWLERK